MIKIKPEDVPEQLKHFKVVHSVSKIDKRVVLMLHGHGDSTHNFEKLALKMALPATAVIVLRAPEPLPFNFGFTWFTLVEWDGTCY